MHKILRCHVKGSYTVEAVLIYPLIILVLSMFITAGLKQYENTAGIAKQCSECCNPDSDKIYKIHHIVERIKE